MPEPEFDYKYEYGKLKQEYADALERSATEIASRQQQINQLHPLARAFEVIDTILRMGQPPLGYGEDIAANMFRRAETLRQEIADTKTKLDNADASS